MYFPYLRGRQNELLCLRELLECENLGDKVVPIIEPIRFNSTLFSTLTKFMEMHRHIIIVANPKVGSFDKEYIDMKRKIKEEKDESKKKKLQKTFDSYIALLKDHRLQKAYILDDKIITEIVNDSISAKDVVLINIEDENYQYYEEDSEMLSAKITLIPRDEDFKDEVDGDAVVIEDGYKKAKRNVDYIASPDDFFSRNHIVYKKKGYVGFSDFSMVGNEFEENGFAPLAIAIHIMYFGNKNEVRVHHFVSESNESISDPARKFEEAMNNLLNWENFDSIPQTMGLSRLIECYNKGKFPGLGVIKKYSLMHHIEMMGKYSWDVFKKCLRNENRFHNKYINLEMLELVLRETKITIPKGTKFYRARISDENGYKRKEMWQPPDDVASPGRANSKGQSCLYLCSHKKTTVKEIRARAFDYVTIATFSLNRNIKVLDLSSIVHSSPFYYSGMDKIAYLVNENNLRQIQDDMAKPMSRLDSELDYLPTQYISDFAKFLGYDGVKYFSTFDKTSYNVALFDASACECVYHRNFLIGDLEYKMTAV